MRTGASVQGRVDGLAAALDALASVDPAELPAAGQLDLLRALYPLLCRLDAQVTRIVGAVHTQGSAGQEGALSTIGWLRSRLHTGGAAPRVHVASALRRLPEVAAAFERGEISFTHAHIAAKTAQQLDPNLLAAGVDKLLADQAVENPPHVFGRAALRIRDHYHPDAADKQARHDHHTEWLDVDKTFGGTVSISGMLSPDNGDLLLATLAAFTPAVNPDDLVPATSRRAEALAQICRTVADRAPQAGGEKPHISVTVDWDTLHGQVSDLFNPRGAWCGASLGSGTALTPETARRLACDAAVIPMVLGAASEPLEVGRSGLSRRRSGGPWSTGTADAGSRLRPSTLLDRRSSPEALGPRWTDQPGQHDPAL